MSGQARRSFRSAGWEHSTITVDCHYKDAPGVAAAYLLVSRRLGGGEAHAAFVDVGTARAVPRLLDALRAEGMGPEDVRFVVITHAHLDHCAGAGPLLAACTGARLLCHPRARRHLAEPSRLQASAEAVYGAEAFHRLYGSVEPVASHRITVMEDRATTELCSGRALFCLHVRGHARHHLVVHDAATRCVLTGDALGICYLHRLRAAGLHRPVLYPATPPTDFEPQEAQSAVRRLAKLEDVEEYMLTHFGGVPATDEVRDELLSGLAQHEAWYQQALVRLAEGQDEASLELWVEEELFCWLGRRLVEAGAPAGVASQLLQDFLRQDAEIHAKGVAMAAIRDHAAQSRPVGKL